MLGHTWNMADLMEVEKVIDSVKAFWLFLIGQMETDY